MLRRLGTKSPNTDVKIYEVPSTTQNVDAIQHLRESQKMNWKEIRNEETEVFLFRRQLWWPVSFRKCFRHSCLHPTYNPRNPNNFRKKFKNVSFKKCFRHSCLQPTYNVFLSNKSPISLAFDIYTILGPRTMLPLIEREKGLYVTLSKT